MRHQRDHRHSQRIQPEKALDYRIRDEDGIGYVDDDVAGRQRGEAKGR